jgi:hypothetical protein
VEPEEASIARQRLGEHIPEATNTQATIELLLQTMFSVWYLQSCYKRRELSSGSSVVKKSAVELCKGGSEEMAIYFS